MTDENKKKDYRNEKKGTKNRDFVLAVPKEEKVTPKKRNPKMVKVNFKFADLELLLVRGCTIGECAGFFGTTPEDLIEAVRFENGQLFSSFQGACYSKGNAILKTLQFKAAEEGSLPMLFWLGKQRLGQRDTPLLPQDIPTDMKTFMHILRNKYNPDDFIEPQEQHKQLSVSSDTFTDDDLANGEETIEISEREDHEEAL